MFLQGCIFMSTNIQLNVEHQITYSVTFRIRLKYAMAVFIT